MPSQQKWDQHWLQVAQITSELSKDPSTKVGAVIVTPDNRQCSLGYNGFAAGIEETEEMWNVREIKYELVVHGELNAIINAPFDTRGCFVYCTTQPCHRCMPHLKNAGIKRIVFKEKYPRIQHIELINKYLPHFDYYGTPIEKIEKL
jgi:dCMP deaminase